MTPPADTPPAVEASSPSAPVGWVLLTLPVWFAVVAGHFLLCSRLAHWLGSPNKLPASLQTLNELFSYGISGALDLVLIVVWMALVFIALIGAVFAVFGLATLLPESVQPAVPEGMFCLAPVAGITLLTLLILPMYSHNAPTEPSGLEVAEMLSFDAFLETMLTGLFAILTIVVLFGGLFAAAAFFMTFRPDGGVWQLFAAILFGITCALLFGFLAGPAVLGLAERTGTVAAIMLFLGACTLLTGPPIALAMRRKTKPKSTGR